MNNAEIQIQFPRPGDWQEFALTAIYRDAEGYTRTDSYTAREIPADQAPAMQAVVAALVGLAEPWKPPRCGRGWRISSILTGALTSPHLLRASG